MELLLYYILIFQPHLLTNTLFPLEQLPYTSYPSLYKHKPMIVEHILVEVMRHIAILLQPFMPGSMARLLDQLGVAEGAREFSNLGPDGALTPGTALPKPEGIFPRFSDEGEGAD